jgi:hypothetical protein
MPGLLSAHEDSFADTRNLPAVGRCPEAQHAMILFPKELVVGFLSKFKDTQARDPGRLITITAP